MTKLECAKLLSQIEFLLEKDFDRLTKEQDDLLFHLTLRMQEHEESKEGLTMVGELSRSVQYVIGNFTVVLFEGGIIVVIDNNTVDATTYENLSEQDTLYLMQAAEAAPDLKEFQRYYKQILDDATK